MRSASLIQPWALLLLCGDLFDWNAAAAVDADDFDSDSDEGVGGGMIDEDYPVTGYHAADRVRASKSAPVVDAVVTPIDVLVSCDRAS